MERTTVAIFVDALGTEVADTHGFLSDRAGRRGPLETVLGYSSSAIPCLLTGTLPRNHGHFSMYRRDLGDGVFRGFRPFAWLAHRTKGRGRLRRWIKSRLERSIDGYFELYDIPLDVLTRFDLCQRRDIFSPGGLAPSESFIDLLQESGLSYRIWSWRDDEETSFRELVADVGEGANRLLMLYTAKLDALMHSVGVGAAETKAKLDEYGEWIDRIEVAAAGRELHLLVFSDHGMTDVEKAHDLHAALDATGLEKPKDYLVFTDSTMARFWFSSADVERRVRDALPGTAWARWLTDEEFVAYGVDFDDRRYGEAIYLLEPGHVIAPSFMGTRACAAMHGYGPEDRTCKAWLYTSFAPDPAPNSILDLKRLFAGEIVWLRGGGEVAS